MPTVTEMEFQIIATKNLKHPQIRLSTFGDKPLATAKQTGLQAFISITVPVGGLIEYNLTPSLAIGAKVQYRSHNQDSIEAAERYSGVTNDFISMGTLQLRWFLCGIIWLKALPSTVQGLSLSTVYFKCYSLA